MGPEAMESVTAADGQNDPVSAAHPEAAKVEAEAQAQGHQAPRLP